MSKRPSTVIAAAALEAAEGLAAIGFGVYVGVETAVGSAVDPVSAIGVTVLALGGGLGMLACARGLLRGQPGSRAPTVLTQLFALPVAWSLWQSEQPFVAIPLGVVAVLTLVLALSPPSTAWLVDAGEPEPDELDGGTGEADKNGPDGNGPDKDGPDRDGPDRDGPDEDGPDGEGEKGGGGRRPAAGRRPKG